MERLSEVWGQRVSLAAKIWAEGKHAVPPGKHAVKLDQLLECFHPSATLALVRGPCGGGGGSGSEGGGGSEGEEVVVVAAGAQALAGVLEEALRRVDEEAFGGKAAAVVTVGPRKRAFIECPGSSSSSSFSLDVFATAREAPGLCAAADGSADGGAVALLALVERSRVARAWVLPVPEGVAFAAPASGGGSGGSGGGGSGGSGSLQAGAEALTSSRLFVGPVLDVLWSVLGADGVGAIKVHYHDDSASPTVG
jgi:hypothetical protein